MSVGQDASNRTGILGLVTAGVGITVFCGMPRFCDENAIVVRPIITDPQVVVEIHLAWRRTSINTAMRRFIETSQKVGKAYMTK
jgi:DNA-binding transcriptional LysR family regulator